MQTPPVPAPTTAAPAGTDLPAEDPLAGTSWQLVSFGKPGAEAPAIAGKPATLEFQAGGQVVGTGGCNTFGASYQVQAGRLSFGPVTSTEMACTEAGVMEQEGALYQALQRAGSFELSGGQLKIEYDGQGVLLFAKAQEDAATKTPGVADPLVGTQWQLESFGTPDSETMVIPGSTITLEFAAGGQAGGNGGCNSYGGEYQVQAGELTFSQLVSTLMACADQSVTEQEQRYLQALQSANRYTLNGDRLTIFYGSEQGVLNFVQAGTSQEPGQTAPVLRIQMIGPHNGWATGGEDPQTADKILFTADGGETWQDRTPPDLAVSNMPGQASPAFFFTSAGRGWVAYPGQPGQDANSGPVIHFTQDSGQTWMGSQPLDFSGIPAEFFAPSDLGFLDEQFGWILAHLGVGMSHDYVALFTTEDGGQTWQRVADPDKNPEIQSCPKSGVVFTSTKDGWLTGDCPGLMPGLVLYHTADGGETWTLATLPGAVGMPAGLESHLGDQCGITQLAQVAGETLKLSLRCMDFEKNTSQGWLYTSQDAGKTWQSASLPAPFGTYDFIDPQEGWLLGWKTPDSQADQEVFHTPDGGQTWTSLAQGVRGGQIDFVDRQNGWIASGNAQFNDDGEASLLPLQHSTDGGKTWQTIGSQAAP